ncbi:MAG TPA: zinc-ribbon domain-containing protein [Terracidiphilus sp.]|nr:zinc-ribbon domain-containing protein [Terracidiphilus sp.]
MNSSCLKCGTHLESVWSFCPHCGAGNEPAAPPAPRDHENAPVTGAFSGLLLGVIVAPVLIIAGGMLCLTGLGAFAGIPMIIAGFCAPLAGPFFGSGSVGGKCPWCGVHISSLKHSQEFTCHACSQHVVVKDHELVKAA